MNPGPGSSLPGGTGADVRANIITNHQETSETRVYRKTWQVFTGGYQFKRGAVTNDNPQILVTNAWDYLNTPYAVFDPNLLAQYMTITEYNQLPVGAYAKKATCKITPVGYRLPFATNDTSSGYANSQTLVQIVTGVGLNKMLNMRVAGYTADNSDLTLPTGYTEPSPNETFFYGTGISTGAGTIGLCTGQAGHWNKYATIYNPRSGVQGSNLGRSPLLMNHVKIQNVNDTKGIPVIDYEYHFKNGLLVGQDDMSIHIAAPIMEGNRALGWWERNKQPNLLADRLDMGVTSREVPQPGVDIYDWYNCQIEKSMFMTKNVGHHHEPDYPPFAFFGVMPVQANAALAAVKKFSDVVCQWQIEVSLEVGSNYSPIYPGGAYFPLQSFDPSWGMLPSDIQNRYGARGDTQIFMMQGRRVPTENDVQTPWDYSGLRITKNNALSRPAPTNSGTKRQLETQIQDPVEEEPPAKQTIVEASPQKVPEDNVAAPGAPHPSLAEPIYATPEPDADEARREQLRRYNEGLKRRYEERLSKARPAIPQDRATVVARRDRGE